MTNVIFGPVSNFQKSDSATLSPNRFSGHMTNHTKKSAAFANIVEFENRFVISLAIPGFDKSDVEINMDKNTLTVQGKKETNTDAKYLRREFLPTEFKRSFTLPEEVNHDTIDATYVQGILSIVVSKGEKALPKKIEIL